MRIVPVHQAMKRSNCKFIDYVDPSFLDKSIQAQLKSCHKKKQDRLYPDLVRLMEGGAPKVRVVEILDRSNPARFYTPPHITTFGVVAATKFRKGEYILCYWGRLRVAEDYAEESVGAESEWSAPPCRMLRPICRYRLLSHGPQVHVHHRQRAHPWLHRAAVGRRKHDYRQRGALRQRQVAAPER